jgi:hypothetical protein
MMLQKHSARVLLLQAVCMAGGVSGDVGQHCILTWTGCRAAWFLGHPGGLRLMLIWESALSMVHTLT